MEKLFLGRIKTHHRSILSLTREPHVKGILLKAHEKRKFISVQKYDTHNVTK